MVVTDYNEQFLDKRGTDHLIEELKAYINGISTGDIDLSDYVTKAELQAKLDALDINIDLSPYATKEELTQAINSIDLSSYATKSEIPSLDGYAKLTDLPTKVSQLENDNNYLTSVPEEYVTETELNAKGYLTEHQDLSDYALKTEIPSLDGLATTEYVDNAIANVPSGGGGNVDLSNYYTKEETNALIPSTEGLATEEYVSTAINSIPATDLSNYYTKDEVYSKSETDALIPTVTDGKDGTDGITPHIDSTTKHWMIGDTDTGVVAEGVNGKDGKDGTNGSDGTNSINGTDGVSPTVTVTKEGKVATITCTDVNGTTTATISDGADGSSSGSGGSSGGASDVYSTEETAIGTWIDEKIIYRKVFSVGKLSSVSGSNFGTVTTTFSDVACGEILRMTGIFKYGTATRIVVDGGFSNNQINPSTNHSTYINDVEKSKLIFIGSSTNVKLWYGADWGGYNYTLVVEYTKLS